jgi:hypothetical protein
VIGFTHEREGDQWPHVMITGLHLLEMEQMDLPDEDRDAGRGRN